MDLLVPVPPIKWMSALTMVSRRAGGAANELLGAGVPAQTEPDAKKNHGHPVCVPDSCSMSHDKES